MKIIYSPFYTERPFLGKQRLFNQVVLNTRGLLAELELRAGQTAVYPSATERIVAYIAAMQQAIQNKGNSRLFFEESFSLDKYGTAKIILDWRDKLVSAGWNGKSGGSDKLDGLVAIEYYFGVMGESDRWQRLLRYAQEHPILTEKDHIEVTTLKEYLSATLTKLLDAIKEKGTRVTYRERAEETDISKPIYHHHFYTDTDAHAWITQQNPGDNDVMVGFDNTMLADLSVLTNRPPVASNEVGVGQQMQMLPLGIALFKTPINAQCLLDYLRLPQSPLRSVYHECASKDGSTTYLRSLNEVLKDVLLKGGLGDAWREELQKPMVDYAHEKMERKRKEVLAFINMWEKSFLTADGQCAAKKTDIIAFVSALRKWAAQRQHKQDRIDAQFAALTCACDEMTMLLETQPDVIGVDDVILWSRQIVQPAILSEAEATIGSPNAVESPTDIYAQPDKVYWLCSTITPAEDMYAFLGEKDRTALDHVGIVVPNKGSNAIFQQKEIYANLQKAKEIHLVSCDVRHGEATMLNDVALQMLTASESSATEIITEQYEVTGIAKPQEAYTIDTGKIREAMATYGGQLRKKESYSSLNTLIHTPFEYVLQYILNLREYQSEALSDINTVKGNVAHRYIEWLTNENGKDASRMLAMHQSKYDASIDTIIEAHGILLLQENNQLDMMLFKSQLKDSVKVLLNILISNQLAIVGSEYEEETDIVGIGKMEAKVDLLLQKNGELYIFDFKWNEGNTYTKKLENNLALQLAVYKNILETAKGQKVAFCGYYILPKHKLLTLDSGVLSDSNIETVVPENTNDIFRQAVNSYNYRKAQLLNGTIEEAELLPIANLNYIQDSLARDLYPLETDYEHNELKGTPYSKPNKVLKGRLQ